MKAREVSNFKAIILSASFFLVISLAAVPVGAYANKEPLYFAVIGDGGTGTESQYAVANQMKTQRDKMKFEFVLMVGDNIYPNGSVSLFKKKFEEPYKELLKYGVKFYAVLGNQDNRAGTEAQIRYDKFNMNGNRYYTFTKGDGLVEYFALDSNDMDAKQLSWKDGTILDSSTINKK